MRLPVGEGDCEVVGAGEAEVAAEEQDVPAAVAAAADAETGEVEGAGRGAGERRRPGGRRRGGPGRGRQGAEERGVVPDVLRRVAAVEPGAAPGRAARRRRRRRRRGVLRLRAHQRRRLMDASVPNLREGLLTPKASKEGRKRESSLAVWGMEETAGWEIFFSR